MGIAPHGPSRALRFTRFLLGMALLVVLAAPAWLIVTVLSGMDPADVPITIYPALGLVVIGAGWALSVMSGGARGVVGGGGRARQRRRA